MRAGRHEIAADCRKSALHIGCSLKVDGCCAPTTSHGPLTVPGTAVTRLLRALWLVQWRRSACLHESELQRRNRAKAPQEHTLHRIKPQVDGSCALDASHRPLNVIGTAVTR